MKNFLYFSLFCFCLLTSLNPQVFSQITEKKKPKIKNFGSSLKRDPQENLSRSENKNDNNDADDEIIRIETNLVVFDYLVLDQKGFSVPGLQKEDFILTEDNQPQEIQTFTKGDDANVSRSIVLIIDYSGSQLPYLERSIEAAKLLVDKLRPNDLMAIVTDDVEIIADYTNDKKKLKSKLNSLKSNTNTYSMAIPFGLPTFSRKLGKSRQYSALYSVLNEMFGEEDMRPIVIFQTDGDELLFLKEQYGNLIYPTYSYNKMTNFSFKDLLNASDKSRATIFTVYPGVKLLGLSPEEKKLKLEEKLKLRAKYFGFNPSRFSPSKEQLEKIKKTEELIKKYYPNGMPDSQETLSNLSEYSGGWIDFLESPEQADGIYSRILDQMDLRYIVSYSPTNEAKDGKRRTVKISVKNHPEYTVWGRKTYLAPPPD